VLRSDTYEVAERVLADGSVLKPLDCEKIRAHLIPELKSKDYQAVAICLLNAYINPAHEQMLREMIAQELPAVHVTISSDITREFREFERASTTSLSAYVQPVMDDYISRFVTKLADMGFKGQFSVMQSNGGKLPAEAMRANAVTALLSGPAAGVMGAARQAARSGFVDLVTLDMGGTSSDVCMVTEGKPRLTTEFTIDRLPVRIPILDINTVGAGGGSIIWVDDGGMLRVGPRSAGADPGPACYGRGGTVPTITDAHIVRGTILPDSFLGGRMEIYPERSREVLRPIADRFGMTLEEAADSAIQISNANIVRSIQVISTERGLDPRDSVLVPFGGAGPLHAAQVAKDLGITTILVPPNSGVISAYGLLASDFVQFDSLTRRGLLDDDAVGIIQQTYAEMMIRAHGKAIDMGLEGDLTPNLVVDMRFVGQAFEVPVEIPVDQIDTLDSGVLRRLFGVMHQKQFFFGADDDKPVEFVSFRLSLTAQPDSIPLLQEPAGADPDRKRISVFDDSQWHEATLLSRGSIGPDEVLSGPLLMEDSTSTLFVPAGWTVRRDANDNMILTANGEKNV